MAATKGFNWGHGIAVFFSCFVTFMLFLVVKSHQQQIDLVAEDYYAQEVAYGQRMAEIQNANGLGDALRLITTNQQLSIQFPAQQNSVEGKIAVYCPSNQNLDFTLALNPDANNQQVIDASNLPRGYYKVQVSWQQGPTPFFVEKDFFKN